jgi:hypothetical protein
VTATTPPGGPLGGRSPELTGPAGQRLQDQLEWYDGKSIAAQRSYKRFKVVQLIISASVPVLAALSAPPAATASAAAAVVVAEGVVQLNQWQTTWVQYRATAEALKHEKYLYLSSAGPYVGDGADRVLAERVEGLVSQEHAKWTEARSRAEAHDQR